MGVESPTGGRQFRFRNQTPEGLSMNTTPEAPQAGTPEFFAVRQVAAELMLRALFQMHPNRALVQTYLERMLGQTLAQPYFVLNKGAAALMKSTLSAMQDPPIPEAPEDH